MTLLSDLSAAIDRAERILARLRPSDGLSYLLVRKAIAEARAAIDAGDHGKMEVYRAMLTRLKEPGTVSRETGKPPGGRPG